jgi:hypothetical protein
MAASLQGVLDGSIEADDTSDDLAHGSSNSDRSSASREVSDTEDASSSASNAPPRHPWALSRKPNCPGASGSSLYRMQTELYAMTMARITEGSVRECPAERAARQSDDSGEAPGATKTVGMVGNPTPYTLPPKP